jgi:membrane peptidoglycan carboxypeptidase
MAERLGITSLPRSGSHRITKRDASLTLGTYEVSPLEMATVYATFASGGIECKPVGVLSMTDRSGKAIPVPSAQCHRAISSYVADSVTQVMRAVFSSYGTGAGLDLGARPVAGKTGTTNDSAATWFSGFTPQYAVSVWVGDPRGGQKYPLHNIEAYGQQIGKVYGRSVAGPVWQETMRGLHEGLRIKQFESPAASALAGLLPPVPDVRGLTRDAAVTALLDAGFRVHISGKTAPSNPNLPPDQVAGQTPTAGTLAAYESEVTLTLTAGSQTNVAIPAPWQVPRTATP